MNIKLNFLDHIAITVRDLEASAKWYEEVLGLKKYQLSEWGQYPIFMLAGKSGLALFPVKTPANNHTTPIPQVTMKHFAFNADRENFETAKQKLNLLSISFQYQDHIFFDSIYFYDPDGYLVEITTLKVNEEDFY